MNGPAPWSEWITHDDVHWLYGEGIKQHGGSGSPSQPGCVDAALGAAYNAELYSMPEVDEETVITGLCFCGYLLFYLATKHCFVDGNKRVAWASSMWVLLRLGLTLQVTDTDAEAFCLGVANGDINNGAEVVNWIAERLVAIQ